MQGLTVKGGPTMKGLKVGTGQWSMTGQSVGRDGCGLLVGGGGGPGGGGGTASLNVVTHCQTTALAFSGLSTPMLYLTAAYF